jgi:AGCS family alanine or glycine:cation symporter
VRSAFASLCSLILFLLVAFAPRPAIAGADEPSGLETVVDEAAGKVVAALDVLLFYPLFQSSDTATAGQPTVEPGQVGALIAQLEDAGVDVSEASFTLTIPSSALSEEQAANLQDKLTARFIPTAPVGSRSFTVVRAPDLTGAALHATSGGLPLIAGWLLAGAVFFTFRMGFINLRAFRHAIDVVRGRYDNPDDEGEVSHFQALASALSATVGNGNIAGVALAVAIGGPGAVFWLIVAGFFGMTAKFTECTLAQRYRKVRPDGRVMGGPMFYLHEGLAEKGLGKLGKVLAIMFAVLCIGGSIGGGNTFQVNQSMGILEEQIPGLSDYRWVYGLIMATAVGVVIIGGIKRIAATAEKIVPAMCGIYVVACLWILLSNVSAIPGAFGEIVSGAFSPEAGYGGFIGVLVTGIRRAAFSNEAGVGSASIAHSAARTEYPVREGIVALLEPFIDTIVVCTMTGLVIVITGAYADAANYDVIEGAKGAALTGRAMGNEISWFPWLLSVAVILFAYSTMISWSYYGERCWCFLFGDRASMSYRIFFLVFTFLGSIITATNILNFGDYMILSMGFPNILGLFFLAGVVKKDLDKYMGDLKAGRFKVYD